MERGGVEGTAQGRTEEGKAGAASTFPDDDAAGLDRGAVEHGQPGLSGLAAGTGQKGKPHQWVNKDC